MAKSQTRHTHTHTHRARSYNTHKMRQDTSHPITRACDTVRGRSVRAELSARQLFSGGNNQSLHKSERDTHADGSRRGEGKGASREESQRLERATVRGYVPHNNATAGQGDTCTHSKDRGAEGGTTHRCVPAHQPSKVLANQKYVTRRMVSLDKRSKAFLSAGSIKACFAFHPVRGPDQQHCS